MFKPAHHAVSRIAVVFCLAVALFGCASVYAQGQTKEKIKVAILTGQNNHAWMMDTRVLLILIE